VDVTADGICPEAFNRPEYVLEGNPTILSCPGPLRGFPKGGKFVWCREYLAPLEKILSIDSEVMRKRLLDFARSTFADVKRSGDRVAGTAPAVRPSNQ
jgi:hypothetical protein